MIRPERRRFRRVPMPARMKAQAGTEAYEVTAINISAGGVLVRTERTLRPQEIVTLHFTLPGTQREIRVTGTVEHVSPGAYMGVRFDDLSPDDKEAIREFVESREPVP